MKRGTRNLLNCHSVGLHSFPISLNPEGLYRRIFYADTNHNLWRPFEIAIHPHHVDIKITVLEGVLWNTIFEIDENGDSFKEFKWNSYILNGKGGFHYLGERNLSQVSHIGYRMGGSVTLKACELHTVFVERNKRCVWLIEEFKPSCEYFPLTYSTKDLGLWSPDGLYVECDDLTKRAYIDEFLNILIP